MPTIYALKCPVTGEIRYIGKSSRPERRMRCHVNDAIRMVADHHNARWIRKLIAAGREPVLVELLKVPPDFDWDAIERFIIAAARSFGFRLTNSTAGGEGFDLIDADASRKWITNLRASNKRPEVIARKTEASRLRAADPNDRLARSAGCKRRYEDPAQRAALSIKHKAQWSDPAWKEKTVKAIRESYLRPEVKVKMSAASKSSWSADAREKRLIAMSQPECVARKATSSKTTWAASSLEARESRLVGLRKFHEARHWEKLRRIMEWDTV